MTKQHIRAFPCSSLPFHQTVRFAFYARVLVEHLVLPVAAMYVCSPFIAMLFTEDGRRDPLLWIFSGVICLIAAALCVPQGILIRRILVGNGRYVGILHGQELTENWRKQWKDVEAESDRIQELCQQQPRLFTSDKQRQDLLSGGPEPGAYEKVEAVLDDIPLSPQFVCYGYPGTHALREIETQSVEAAERLVRHLAGQIAGKLLCRAHPIIVMKHEQTGAVRLTFLTDIPLDSLVSAYLWIDVFVRSHGRAVTCTVDTRRTYLCEKGDHGGGYRYRGDAARAKAFGVLALTTLGVLSPLCLFLAPFALKESLKELFGGRLSAEFFLNYRPGAGDTVDLLIIGQSGSGVTVFRTFDTHTAGIANELVAEVHNLFTGFDGQTQAIA